MKLIKHIATVLLLTFSFSTISAQNADSKALIVNKWVIDKEAMKPVVLAAYALNPQFMAMDEAGKAAAISMTMDQLDKLKVEYKIDGVMLRNDPTGFVTGKWSLSEDGKVLTTKAEGKPDKVYNILEISKNKIDMMSTEGRNIILKTE